MQQVPWLPAKTQQLLEGAIAALEKALGDALVSASLVGAAMHPGRGDRAQAPEILVVVSDAKKLRLGELAAALKPVMTKGLRVRIVSAREIERSLDVFALEIAEWKARHLVLHGKDAFAEVVVGRNDLRLALELELRGVVRRVRNRILAGLATDRSRDDPREALVDGYDRLAICVYHALALVGVEEPPVEEAAFVALFGERAKIDTKAFARELEASRKGASAKIDPLEAFEALLTLTDAFIELVDNLEPDSRK